MPARHRLGRHRAAEEPRPTQNKESHALTLSRAPAGTPVFSPAANIERTFE
ncbi:hypothetical protein UO65_4133 [Actinokineospora spheciospongiae]|uniref:Uncharacterized protein n=1 Tax=Actinokineospora spheciospongiae TaxID=909613 RepID=W7IVX1_9PSEU|nr:hypothetical protein UO65_4133 [Actinokineospora spheciospongiae]